MDHEEKELRNKYPELEEAPISITIPVLWGDMDSANHVNNLVYLKWTETSRILLFQKMMDTSFKGKQGPILGWQDCKYIFPLTFPDKALVATTVTNVEADRFTIESRIYSLKHLRIAAISQQSIIPYDYVALQKIKLPEQWVEKLSRFKSF